MKKFVMWLMVVMALVLGPVVSADDEIESTIDSYVGALKIKNDNTAVFTEEVTFTYDSDFNGQYISLGTERMPEGFDIIANPSFSVFKNGKQTSAVQGYIEKISGGYRLKIYDGGEAGDKIKVTVIWDLKNVTYAHQDVAQLLWKPISDWDETLQKVTFYVEAPNTDNKETHLWAHRGYFKEEPKVTKTSRGYRIEATDVDGVLEVHGYWDASILSDSVPRLSTNGKADLLKTEQLIRLKSDAIMAVFLVIIPLGFIVLAIVLMIRSRKLSRAIDRFNPKGMDTRLYEIPEDLSPLVLAKEIYETDFHGVLPDGDYHYDRITFSTLVQSILVDLIDRNHLRVEEEATGPVLSIVRLEGLTKYEVSFLDMAFGGDLKRTPKALFSDYEYNEKAVIRELKKTYKGEALQSAVRRSGSAMTNKINKMVQAIDKSVRGTILGSKRAKIYREMTDEEKRRVGFARTWSVLGAVIAGGIMLYLLVKGSFMVTLYMVLLVWLILAAIVVFRQFRTFEDPGIVTEEGADRLLKWQSFERMIASIDQFDDVELQGVVLWNRMLVYANLLGYADKVEKYLKVHQIALPETLDNVDFGAIRMSTLYSASHFTSVTSSASSASSFSISSGSSSGSGGFAGGGGGGGGGSF